MDKIERFDGFQKTGSDADIEKMLAGYCEKHRILPLEAMKMYTVLAGRRFAVRRIRD